VHSGAVCDPADLHGHVVNGEWVLHTCDDFQHDKLLQWQVLGLYADPAVDLCVVWMTRFGKCAELSTLWWLAECT
jgi:hypothetical protein